MTTKLRLIVLGIVTTLSIITILGVTKVFHDEELKLLHIKQDVLGINKYVLHIEDDIQHFIIKKQKKYIKFALDNSEHLSKHIENLKKRANSEKLQIANLSKIIFLQKQYMSIFNDLYLIEEEIGLNPNDGYMGEMRKTIRSVENVFKKIDDLKIQNHILSIRRAEKDFLLRKNMKYFMKITRK